ncbi:MAG: methyltransferase domain-containing protein [Pyrinomonadaceae bacterium]
MKKSKPVQRVEYILSQCEGKEVLHLGCTNWPYTQASIKDGTLLHSTIAKRSSSLFGIDADEKGLAELRASGYSDLFLGNLEDLSECSLNRTFDVVVAGEVIEHLNNPGLFLEGVKRYLRHDSVLILTTINAYGALRYALYSLKGKRGENEPVHPDHVAYYSFSTLGLLLRRHNFDVGEFLFYDLGPEHRKHLRFLFTVFNDAAVRVFPQLCDGIIARCSFKDPV